MTISYVVRRLLVFLVVVWAAASLNFVVPRLAPGDPIGAMLGRLSLQGASVKGSDQIIAKYRQMFGLDESLAVQYVKYLGMVARLDLGYSIAHFPVKVMEIVRRGLPWTIGLLTTTTLISFTLGILLGALLMWRGTPRAAQLLVTPLIILAAIPYYLLAIVLLFLLAFALRLFPSSGIARVGTMPEFSLSYILDVIYHSILPSLSLVLASIGGWMLGMRGMMVTVLGSDFLTLARAKGLKGRRIFLRYAVRNAILPQVTGLAISLGHVVSGTVLVEVIFSYPGIGHHLYAAITNADYPVTQGITFILVLSVAMAIFILDLVYPKLDPRITYARR
jgi:peptide/nickel transport system permease protein